MEYSRAAVVPALHQVEMQEFPLPEIGPEETLLHVDMCGVCGSDPAWWTGKLKLGGFPIILGHEIVGTVARIGREAARGYGVKEGDRVVVESSISCQYCRYCMDGRYHLCENRRGYGHLIPTTVWPALWGAYSQYMYVAPHSAVHKLPDAVPSEVGVLICAVLANGVRWVREFGTVGVGDAVVVQGAGPQGLAAVVAAHELGASLIVVTGLSRDAHRLEMARRLGAHVVVDVERKDPYEELLRENGGRQADVILNMHGGRDVVSQAQHMVRKGGVIVQAGLGPGPHSFDLDALAFREVRLQGVFTHLAPAVREALNMVQRTALPLAEMVTHQWSLDEAELALRAVGGEVEAAGLIKGVLVP